jgi:hypothetical protein
MRRYLLIDELIDWDYHATNSKPAGALFHGLDSANTIRFDSNEHLRPNQADLRTHGAIAKPSGVCPDGWIIPFQAQKNSA